MLIYLQMIETPEDRSKFEIIYEEYRDMLYTRANGILHNKMDAEDATHQAFVKIAENIKKISDPRCPKSRSYFVIILEHAAIDIYRAKKKRGTVRLIPESVGLAVEYTGNNELARCLAKLPDRERHILLLKHYHGYSLKEIAKMLNLSLSNATKIEQRARAKLEVLCKRAEIL